MSCRARLTLQASRSHAIKEYPTSPLPATNKSFRSPLLILKHIVNEDSVLRSSVVACLRSYCATIARSPACQPVSQHPNFCWSRHPVGECGAVSNRIRATEPKCTLPHPPRCAPRLACVPRQTTHSLSFNVDSFEQRLLLLLFTSTASISPSHRKYLMSLICAWVKEWY